MKAIYTSSLSLSFARFGVAADCYLMSCSLWMKIEACRPHTIRPICRYIYGDYDCLSSINCLNVYKYFTAPMGGIVCGYRHSRLYMYSRSFSCCRAHWSNQINGRHNPLQNPKGELKKSSKKKEKRKKKRVQGAGKSESFSMARHIQYSVCWLSGTALGKKLRRNRNVLKLWSVVI